MQNLRERRLCEPTKIRCMGDESYPLEIVEEVPGGAMVTFLYRNRYPGSS